ncbi:TetR/AcrR family transcriptional regulator [Sansalvadorimonas verongulae]|uniref:TetR/AcrR family transcriptional regulator n=1 Tax=Sansalvadorimonas verongulae TaxID=2172824 RepID=UPI0012BD2F53|nr:TetR/AcrR family transcriptional regulator [Sansalvadorimonas verongulae]MTI15440.1 TetR/AcrR family transcriptional regulator [Sansalvadorimonas verongulae]
MKISSITEPDSPRGRLLEAAAKLFRKKGYDRTTVRDIANEVGILSGSIFHHFRNKDEILRAVMSDCVENLLSSMADALRLAKTPEQRIRTMIHCELEAILGEKGNALTVLVFEWRALSKESQGSLLDRRHDYERLWQKELMAAAEAGITRRAIDPLILRRFLGGALYWTSNWYQEDGDYNLEQLTDQALQFIKSDNKISTDSEQQLEFSL